MPLLEARDVLVTRQGRPVLELEYLALPASHVLAVIGPNGAGKSTLLLALASLLRPTHGQILFHGQPLQNLDELAYRRNLGLVFQDPLLLETSVFENVALGLRFRNFPRQRIKAEVEHWLEQLGIFHLRNRPARQLSGGEGQRVSLARAFAIQPEVLLLDEPFTALDAPTRARLLLDFQALLASTGISALCITHDLDEALLLGDTLAVLINGRLRQYGPPQEVFSAPADAEVAAFVGVETVIAGQVIENQAGLVHVRAGDQLIEATGETAAGRPVLVCLRPEDIILRHPNGEAPSSARNHLKGVIRRLIPQGVLVRVEIDCGFFLVALVTRASAHDLELSEGQPISAAFKASAVHLIPK